MIKSITPQGPYLLDTSLPGIRKTDRVMPSHPCCVQLSRERFLVLFGIRGFMGVDDDREIVYQIRAGAPDGRVLKEGILARCVDDWDPMGRGESLKKVQGTPVAFGVPKGALIGGRPAINANVFAIAWYTYPKRELKGGFHIKEDRFNRDYIRVEWMQCRLNDAEDDIEVVQPVRRLRQVGYETGPYYCALEDRVAGMNHSIKPPVPFNAECTEWVEVAHFYRTLAAVKYRFDPEARLYEWVETGLAFEDPERTVSEACISRVGDAWCVSARSSSRPGATAWFRTGDPFAKLDAPVYVPPNAFGPRLSYTCADGVLRLFGGDMENSPYREKRNPHYCWDIDPNTFAAMDPRVVFDVYAMGFYEQGAAAFEGTQGPFADFGKLFPPVGNTQIVAHRFLKGSAYQRPDGPQLTSDEEIARFGIYHAVIEYDNVVPQPWSFGEA